MQQCNRSSVKKGLVESPNGAVYVGRENGAVYVGRENGAVEAKKSLNKVCMAQCEGRVRRCPNGAMLRTSTWD